MARSARAHARSAIVALGIAAALASAASAQTPPAAPFEDFGYYPNSLFGSGALATKANKIGFGGEATGNRHAEQMGSGNRAAEGGQKAAFVKSAFHRGSRQDPLGRPDRLRIRPRRATR
jgi:neprosin-like protein